MSRKPQHRSKEWGREVENLFLRSLKVVFPNLRRVGSMGYSGAHPDLVQDDDIDTHRPIVRIVATKDKRKSCLVTMSLEDFTSMSTPYWGPVVVQCKGRAKTWIGSLYQELKEATK
jgi:hypothetical protein